jgi:hypothetical protein
MNILKSIKEGFKMRVSELQEKLQSAGGPKELNEER